MIFKIFIVFTVVFTSVSCKESDEEKSQIVKVQLTTQDQVSKLVAFGEEHDLNFWIFPNLKRVTAVLVKDEEFEAFKAFLVDDLGIETFDVIVSNANNELKREDLENEVEKKIAGMRRKFRGGGSSGPIGYFARLDEIYGWYSQLASKYENVKVEVIGKTSENRDMKVIKINANSNKPIVFIEAGIHAREWLSPATILYVIDKLIQSKGQSELLRRYQVHILAVTNPDGYEFTHENKLQINGRFWRRTRRVFGQCVGVDMNRNFDADFGRVGVSKRCNSDIYPGDRAFSEPESRNLRDYVKKHEAQIKMYMSVHTFGQMWLIPYSFSDTHRPDNWDELKRVGKIGAAAIQKVNGKRFSVGTVPQVLNTYASGGSMDWAKLRTKIPYVFGLELRPTNVNAIRGGFNPSPREIVPSGQEIFAAFEAVAQAMK